MAEKDNISVDQSQLFRGETPEDIDSRCLTLCQDYIGSVWSQQTVDSIRVKRITGGLTNQLYCCAIKDPVPGVDAPQEVAISFYGKKWFKIFEQNERLSDIIVAIMVSANGLGPKVYGLFDGGMIQHFYHVCSMISYILVYIDFKTKIRILEFLILIFFYQVCFISAQAIQIRGTEG